MAMSRSLGGRSLTTRSPIRISPDVTCSSPASMRSSVDLPQPDGPTRTTNSPSAMSMETPCSTSTVPKDLRTSRIVTTAMLRSPLSLSLTVAAHLGARNRLTVGRPALPAIAHGAGMIGLGAVGFGAATSRCGRDSPAQGHDIDRGARGRSRLPAARCPPVRHGKSVDVVGDRAPRSSDSHRGSALADAVPARPLNAEEAARATSLLARLGKRDYVETRLPE